MQSISKRPFVQLSSLRLISAAAVCATLLCAFSARAQDVLTPPVSPPVAEPPPVAVLAVPQGSHFGMARQWFLSAETFWTPFTNGPFSPGGNTGDVSLSWSSQDGSGTKFLLNLQPVVGYFFTDVIFGRLGFDIAYGHSNGADAIGVGLEPGIGMSIPMAPKLAFAPWIGVNFMYVHAGATSSSVASDITKLNLEVHVPVVIDITDHFALTTGIYYAQGLVNHLSSDSGSGDAPKIGTVGLTAGLLGYW